MCFRYKVLIVGRYNITLPTSVLYQLFVQESIVVRVAATLVDWSVERCATRGGLGAEPPTFFFLWDFGIAV